jgi:SAM-dependent methyltransferase
MPGCPVCSGQGAHFRTFGSYALLRCSTCESLYFFPPPKQELVNEDRTWESPKWYVERGANLLFYAEIISLVQRLLRSLGDGTASRRVLEAGGSYGFLLDMGREIFGWEVAAADPSPCALTGGRDLGIPIQNVRVEEARFEGRFDAVVGVQLIEHLHNPSALLDTLSALLNSQGIVFLTTPDAAFDDLGPDYHPGEHVILFSRRGLTFLLGAAGLEHSAAFPTSLPQMLALAASKVPLPGERESEFSPAEGSAVVERYLARKLAKGFLPGSLHGGLSFRLFELLVNAGRYGEAVALEGKLEELMGRRPREPAGPYTARLAEAMVSAGSPAGYERAGPGFAAPYLLYRGILELNHKGRRDLAAESLGAAVKIFEHEVNCLDLVQYEPFLAAARSALEAAGGASL